MFVEPRSAGPDPDGAESRSDGSRSDGSRSLTELLAALENVVEEITAREPDELGGAAAAEAAVRVHRASDRLRAQQVCWLGVVESTGSWRGAGARTLRAWLARAFEVSYIEASAMERNARAWHSTLAATGAAARAGEVSTAKAALIASIADTPERIAALGERWPEDEGAETRASESGEPGPDGVARDAGATPTGECVLLDLARGYGVADFAKIARRFAHVVDPEADERGYREALDREFLDLAATTGGYHLSGFLTRDHGQVLKTAMRAVTGIPDTRDARTANQRRAGALVGLSRLVLDKGLTGKVGTVRPHLSVHVSLTELEDLVRRSGAASFEPHEPHQPHEPHEPHRPHEPNEPRGSHEPNDPHRGGPRVRLARLVTTPPAEWEDRTGPIPASVLREIATDCDVTRIVFGPDSQVIDVGRTRRTFAGHLRRAVVARDRACVIDGCGAPASMSEVHHARLRWADGGDTRVRDAALVCGFHNRWLEEARVPMRWVPDPRGGGRWQLGRPGSYRPDGTGEFPPDKPDHRDQPDQPEQPDQPNQPGRVPRPDTS